MNDALSELRETADWLEERAVLLRDRSSKIRQGDDRQALRDEAARWQARAMLIRQMIQNTGRDEAISACQAALRLVRLIPPDQFTNEQASAMCELKARLEALQG